jgi:hypothetical protein
MRLDIRFRQKVERNKKAKEETKKQKILVPEVYVSNFNKQQRKYSSYKQQVSGGLCADWVIESES